MADETETTAAPVDENGFGRDPRIGEVRARIIKLRDEGVLETRAIQNIEEDEQFFSERGALEPPYDPRVLVLLFEHSNALRQNVDAYATNIDGFGHAFTAVTDLEADSTEDDVRALIAMERQGDSDNVQVEEPTDEEVQQRIKQLANEQRAETLKLAAFFDDCSEMSFVDLRRRTREDVEITGNGYWEVVRNRVGGISQFNYVEAFTVRLTKLDVEMTEYKTKRRTPTQDFEDVTRKRRFRRYIQKVAGQAVFFKEFGDPRVVSSRSGKAFADVDAMQLDEKHSTAATEMMHFKVPSSRTAYGVPRWIGNLLSVFGSRQSEEVNFSYFENKSVPPLAVLVSGGRLTKDSTERLESFITNNIRGKQNYHKILVIEAEGGESQAFENSGRMKIELKPLTEAQNSDGLFQNYDERNIDKVGMSFRLPRMLRGDTRDFNRSTAMAALDFAERQVFEPERQTFDYRMNRDILPALNVKRWKLKSNGPTQRDPESLAKMIHDLQDFIPPNILMELSQGVFNRNFPRIDAPWADMPLKLTLASVNQSDGLGASTPEAEDTNPDNQAPNSEPESSTTETGDNQAPADGQGRTPNGQFGGNKPPKPPKQRVTPARKQFEVEVDEEDLDEIASVLVALRNKMARVVTRKLVTRTEAERARAPAGEVEP